ncbi:MAG: hypothetical protein PHP36_00970 [Atribacterota bacterium]|nr:hypothetical protein [Atribacterota bacterium]
MNIGIAQQFQYAQKTIILNKYSNINILTLSLRRERKGEGDKYYLKLN